MSGAAGVDLFFVISGFIMLYTSSRYFGAPGAAGDFLKRRLVRIVPLYWLCTLAVVALALTGAFYKSKLIAASNTASSLLFLPTDNLILGVGWTLQYEMYFYLLFAACLAFATAWQTIIVLPLLLGTAWAASPLLPTEPVRAFLANPIALEFSFGLWLAYGFVNGKLPRFNPVLAAALGVAGIGAASVIAVNFLSSGPIDTGGLAQEIRFFAWGVPALLIVYAGLHVKNVSGGVGGILLLLGNASYSIYLTHALVMTAYAKALKSGAGAHLPPLVLMALAAIVALAVGIATYKFVERPITEWLKNRYQGKRAPDNRHPIQAGTPSPAPETPL